MKMKRISAGLFCACMVLSCTLPAQAAETADVYRGILIVEGISTSCQDANGADIPVLTYDGSTYVPLRAVGQWMGKEVNWDAATRTITLQGNVVPEIRKHHNIYAQATKEIVPSQDITVVVDGTTRHFTGADGNPVYPISVNGASYLPLRAVGELLGMEVFWFQQGNNTSIFLRTPLTDAQKQEMQTYLDALDEIGVQLKALSQKLSAMRGEPPVTAEAGLQTADQMSVLLEKLAAMKIPDTKIWEPYVSSLKTGIETERNMLEHYVSHVKSGKSPDSFQQQYINPEDSTLVDENGLVDMTYAATWFNVALNQYTKEIQLK